MAGITLTGDWTKANRALQRLASVNFTSIHEEIGEAMLSSVAERFRKEQGPDGERWPRSIRAKVEGGQTLRDTGRLRSSFTYRADATHVDIGTNVRYASVHQHGMTIRAKRARYLRFNVAGRWAQKVSVRIPARPMLGISEEDRKSIVDIIRERIEEALR